MSSKVVHLSAEAHSRAKDHCQKHRVKMSHWVADLIAQACAQADDAAWVPRKALPRLADDDSPREVAGPAFAAPPFWADGQPT